MPNWCSNKLLITGPDVPGLLNTIGDKESVISFNKIFPIPEALELSAGSNIDLAVGAVAREDVEFFTEAIRKITEILPQNPFLMYELGFITINFGDKGKEAALYSRIDQNLETGLFLSSFLDEVPAEQNYRFTLENLVEMGKLILTNVLTYGAPNWFAWRVQNWGTKWSLDDQVHVELTEDHAAIIFFDTAWSPPCPIIVRLGQMYPQYKFKLTWHEGGNNYAGRLFVHGDKQDHKDYRGYSEGREQRDFETRTIPKYMQWKRKSETKRPGAGLPHNIEEFLTSLERKGNTL